MSTAVVNGVRTPPEADGRPRWIRGPVADLIVGCGAWSAPLLAFTYVVNNRFALTVAVVFYVLALVSNYPHFFATIYRAYSSRSEFERYRIFTLYVTTFLVLTGVLAHWSHLVIPWLVTLYLTWSPWHYTGQNFGLAVMFARRNGAAPTRAERNWLFFAYIASYLMIFVTLHTGPTAEPYVVSLGLSEAFAYSARITLAVAFVFAAVVAMKPLVARCGVKAMSAPLVLLATQFLWFALPGLLDVGFGIQLPRTYYSASILAFMHGAQYLWITSYYAKRQAVAEGVQEGRKGWSPWRYYGTLVAGGIALFVPGPWIASYVFEHDFTASFLIFTALVNLHHFVLDGAIWKLRDKRVASVLLDSGRQESSPASEVAQPRTLAWLTGSTAVGRGVRVALVVVLLAIAFVDQIRFFYAFGSDEPSRLRQAERLNPYDAPVYAKLARTELSAGNTDAAIDLMKKAVAIDPYNSGVQRQLARTLLETGRFDEAYDQHKSLLEYVTPDSDTLTNYGVLAMDRGDAAAAIDAWRRAIALDRDAPLPRIYLGDGLTHEGKGHEAIAEYEKYLDIIGRPENANRLNPSVAMAVSLKVGDLYQAEKKVLQAGEYYKRVLELATEAGDAYSQGTALSRLGSLYGENGDPANAALCLQRAIGISRLAGDRHGEAINWYNYGQFLAGQNVSPRLPLACLLRARSGLDSGPEEELKTVEATITRSRNMFGNEVVEGVEKDLDRFLDEAIRYVPKASSPAAPALGPVSR